MDKQEIESAVGVKPPSNVSEIFSKFAKVSKFRSIGVFNTSGNPNKSDNQQQILSVVEESISDAVKIHPNPSEEQRKKVKKYGGMEILKLFDTLVALKLAYVKLQEAHLPYNPDKIRAADEEVVSHLQSLCKIKKAYTEKEVESVSLLLAQVQALEKLKSLAKSKEKEVFNLRHQLGELEMGNKKLAQEKESLRCLAHYSFEDIVKAVGRGIHDFAKPLIALMKASDWDLDRAANVIQDSVAYAKRSHKKYAFEAFVARRMFHGFSPQPCILENIMELDDPTDALIKDPQCRFAKFCRAKYLLVVHPKMEASFFGNLDHRTLVANGIHPLTPFYRAFVKMARWVWFLQGFATSVEPKAEIFGVKQGSEFSDVYMEVPEELKEYKSLLDKGQERCKVEFMIVPGFRRGETLVRSQVYVSKVGFSNGT